MAEYQGTAKKEVEQSRKEVCGDIMPPFLSECLDHGQSLPGAGGS